MLSNAGQVGAIRLGISRALQNSEPGLRPYLKAGKIRWLSPQPMFIATLCSPRNDLLDDWWHYETPVFWQPFTSEVHLSEYLVLLSFYISIWAFQKLLTSMCMHRNSWIFDERFTCGRKEKAWKGESKKELPVGQAVTGKFALFAKSSREFGFDIFRGILMLTFFNVSEPSAGLHILLWQVSALCCGFSSQHGSLDLLLFSGRSFSA